MTVSQITHYSRAFVVVCCLIALSTPLALARQAAQPTPKEYKVLLRYRIRAGVSQRLEQWGRMIQYFRSIGFQKDPGAENEAENADEVLMSGTIPSANARKLLVDQHVRSLLLLPAGYELPAGDDELVLVRLELNNMADLQSNRRSSEELIRLLEGIGFQETVGYDNRGHTRLLGTVPASKVRLLLQDLRMQSDGWLAPAKAVSELPPPLRDYWPLVVTEVIPVPAGVPVRTAVPSVAAVPRGQEHLLKISRELRSLKKNTATRIEVVLASAPQPGDQSWQHTLLAAVPGLEIGGRLGPLVTVRTVPQESERLAKLSSVISVRLPRAANYDSISAASLVKLSEQVNPANKFDRAIAGAREGSETRVAVIDDDFSGYEQMRGKQIPTDGRIIDLTAESDPQIESVQPTGGDGAAGHGTRMALAIAKAIPGAKLTLVRIDRDAPYQLYEAARYFNGDPVDSISLDRRREELADEASRLESARDRLLKERKVVFENFSQDKASVARREAYQKKQADLDQREELLRQRERRLIELTADLGKLKGTSLVVCGLAWNDGYPLKGSSILAHYLNDRPSRGAAWSQTTGSTSSQAWSGLFRDEDENGVMECAAPGSPLPAGRWSSELNFLGWQPTDGAPTPDLPKTKLRISIQWREPHDASLWNPAQDLYRVPLANLKLMVLHQRDSSGTTLPADDLEVVAQSADLPLRLDNQRGYCIYEQTLEFEVNNPGRYALRVEGRLPPRTRPANEPTLPVMGRRWECWPRIFVSGTDATEAPAGRPVFWDFKTPGAEAGMRSNAGDTKK
jgi:hypothetical protein